MKAKTRHVWLPLCLFLSFLGCASKISAQELYYRAYGERGRPVLIYIHGGPRGNSTLFEGTTAQRLADQGYYVIAYDRRGEGRSVDTAARFTFREAISDLNDLIDRYKLGRVNLIGHSFGGIVATYFSKQYPEKVDRLILAGALVNQQQTYDHILSSVQRLANNAGDTAALKKLGETKKQDRRGASYRKLCYELAGSYGFFRMPKPTEAFRRLSAGYEESVFGKTNIRNDQAPLLFYRNEEKVNVDNLPVLRAMVRNGQKVYGVYGRDDRIFSDRQLIDIRRVLGSDRFVLIGNCSHYPFVDQQQDFIRAVNSFMEK